MKKESILYGIIGLLAGTVIAWATAVIAVNNNHRGMMDMMGMDTSMMRNHDGMSMDDMTSSLQGKTGDDFDEAFLSGMIAHHQGAIDMANLAKQNAKHQEIKDMADDIIAAQSTEIDQMRTWQSEWGYDSTPQDHMMGH